MSVRFPLLLALTLIIVGCAAQSGYSGSRVDGAIAVQRSSFIFVGKILTSERTRVGSNTFFVKIRCDVKVVQPIRGKVEDVVSVGYALDGIDSETPFHIGDLCIFCIYNKSLLTPGEYTVGKILSATPENIAAVQNYASGQ